MGQTITETERLLIRELDTCDAEFMHALVNSEGWLRNVGDRNIHSTEQAAAYLERGAITSYRANGFGLWMVADKSSGVPMGICGLISRPGLDDVDIGFAFMPEFQGRGFAYEAAGACMAVAARLDIKKVVAITLPGNTASIRLLEKLGFRFVETVNIPPDTVTLNLYAVTINN